MREDARWARHPARRRPHYGPYERMRILELRAARGWSAFQTAERFLVTEETIDSWMRTLQAGGESAMVRMREDAARGVRSTPCGQRAVALGTAS